jgi:hypothetical protein
MPEPTCMAVATVDQDEGTLICSLPPNHEGLHYDRHDDISWKEGQPDA